MFFKKDDEIFKNNKDTFHKCVFKFIIAICFCNFFDSIRIWYKICLFFYDNMHLYLNLLFY